ncbi:hypothetical protein L6452_40828 [Arctium lappa]|uniref:Uncharacterized protein n=1 Tax=Arctium lappa TaxID=4217 RepID=A0ACB8XNI9_ARCLA|nr:hypothetical protein L6452_40828 [Arctium lappa]
MREFAPRDGSQGNDFSYYSNQIPFIDIDFDRRHLVALEDVVMVVETLKWGIQHASQSTELELDAHFEMDAHEESRSVTKAAAVKGLDVYRHVVLPPEVAKLLPKNRLLSELQQRCDRDGLGVKLGHPTLDQDVRLRFSAGIDFSWVGFG